MSGRRIFRGILWGLLALVLVVHVLGGWMYSDRIIDEDFTPAPAAAVIPVSDEVELVEVQYESPLGIMDAWHLPASGDTWVIHIHGLNATPVQAQPLFAALQQAGYPQLSITYRNDEGQPTDPSGYHRYGTAEWEDVGGAVDFALANGAREVVFAGYGTGASHALSYVFRHNLDEIAAVITDSAHIDVGSTIDYRGTLEKLPVVGLEVPTTMAWVAKFFTSLRIDVNWKTLDYVDRAQRSLRVPLLAIHGTADESVPIAQSIALDQAQPDLVQLEQFEGAAHVGSFNTDHDRYVSTVLAFLDDVS
ncbi:MAG TPA: prolyl oligopeptidase family serine peptidase [Acidimicrobiia bacterium]|nr:prolyl oligopeptidase family serine peptidase [Acidimicrobiia bacterium]